MSSYEFFFRVAFCFAKIRLFRVTLSLHSFAPLRNWLRQPLQSLPRFVNQILEIEPNNIKKFFSKKTRSYPFFIFSYKVCPHFSKKKLHTRSKPLKKSVKAWIYKHHMNIVKFIQVVFFYAQVTARIKF